NTAPSRALIVSPQPKEVASLFAASSGGSGARAARPAARAGDGSRNGSGTSRRRVVVIGNGMVGHRLCERLLQYDEAGQLEVTTFCEEPRPAYDRVQLTKYFETRDPGTLAIAQPEWYTDKGVN